MKYILTEATSENVSKDDIKEIAECMRVIQYFNERGFYTGNIKSMGFHGFKIPTRKEYETFVENALIEPDAKIYMAREACCKKEIVGLAVGGVTDMAENECSGRLLFFWTHPSFRKNTLTNNLYKKMWGWFDSRKCISVSITFKHFQEKMAKYFMNKGYEINNMELVGPIKFLEAV